jgi:hypothetical protein
MLPICCQLIVNGVNKFDNIYPELFTIVNNSG